MSTSKKKNKEPFSVGEIIERKGMIIDWMDGRHLQFDTYEEAEKEYEKMLKDYEGGEIDLQLLEIKKEHCNIK